MGRSRKLGVFFLLVLLGLTATPIAYGDAIFAPVNPGVIRPGYGDTVFAPNDDETYPFFGGVAQPLGFTIDFFGEVFTHAFINNNGNITFDERLETFTPFGLTGGGVPPIIAPFFADVDTRFEGSPVTWGYEVVDGRDTFGVNWLDVDYYFSDPSHVNRNNFQLVLTERPDTGPGNFDIEFNYAGIQWETGEASGSDENGRGGVCAHAGYSNGTGVPGTFFEIAGSGVCGAFLDGTGDPDPPFGGLPGASNIGEPGRFLFLAREGEVIAPPPVGGGEVPEPATLFLLGTGLAGIGARYRNRNRKQ